MAQRTSRPIGITILAVFEILIGIVGLLASLAIIGFPAFFSSLPRVGSLLGAIGLIIGGIVLFFSIVWFATGVGFLRGSGWSRTLGIVFGILSLLGAAGALTIGLITGGVGGLFFWGLMLYYLTRTHVKAFFGKGGLSSNPANVIPYSLGPQVNQGQMATSNAGYGRPSVVDPLVTIPPISKASSASIPVPSSSSSASKPSGSSDSGKIPICAFCHNTLPQGTRKCLTCGAAL